MKTYRVGLIGFGFIGKVHAYCHTNLPYFYDQTEFGSRITAVCTSHRESALRAAAVTGAARAVTDFREITEDPDVDVVDVCTPNDRHFEALRSAMLHGKHIYCDKPLVATAAEAQQLEAVLPRYHGIAQVTLQNRFFPAILRAKQLLDEGRIGDILTFRAAFRHSGSADPEAPLKWKLQAGTIADLGSHVFDLVDFLTGGIAEVAAATRIAYPERPAFNAPGQRLPVPAEDAVCCLVRLASGALGTVEATKIATGTEDELEIEINGARGALRWHLMHPDQLHFYDATAADHPIGGCRGWTAIDCGTRLPKPAGFPSPKSPVGWLRGHVHSLYCFLEAVHRNCPAAPSLADGIRLQYLLEKVRQSAADGRWVRC